MLLRIQRREIRVTRVNKSKAVKVGKFSPKKIRLREEMIAFFKH